MNKCCTSCKSELPLEDFGKQSRGLHGRRSKCRKCTSEAYSKWHSSKWSSDEEWRRKRTENSSTWAINNPDKRSIIAVRRNHKERIEKPEVVKCRALVNQRVRFGRMPRAKTLTCFRCGETAAHYHHHNGYSFESRYDVVPVCHACHRVLG